MPGCYAAFHKQLGDLVLLEPALSKLRDSHGGPVRLFTRGGHTPLVELMAGTEFVRGFAASPCTDFYCFDPLNKSAVRSITSPVLRRHLIVPEARELKWFHPLLFRRAPSPEIGDSYVAEFFWKHTPVPSDSEFRPPRLERPPTAWGPPGIAPNSFILINATSGWRMKMWTPSAWATVIAGFGGEVPCLLTNGGQPWQTEHCQKIIELAEGSARILPSSMREFLWLCANARAMLTVDGSASHLAAAFGTPVLTLFGPTNSKNWHRTGPRNSALVAPDTGREQRHLRDLDPAEVLPAALSLLAEKK